MIQRLLPFLSLIVLFVALSIASPHFLTDTNLSSVVRQTAVINIMALGMTMIIIAGGIDLSVGAILAMGGLIGTMAMEKGAPIPVGIAIGVLTGLACGLMNGVLTTRLKIAPFIVTLGTLIGAFIMGLLSNGSDLLGVSPYLQQAIIGAVIILAVTVDELRKRRAV